MALARRDTDATRSFLRILNHELRPSRLFTPAFLARGTARTIRGEPGRAGATLKEAFASAAEGMRQMLGKTRRPPGAARTAG